MGKIARLYKISTVAVLKWVRAAALDVAPLNSTCASDIVMIDEVWHFVNGKKTKYGFGEPLTGYRVDHLGWKLGRRGDASAKKLISRIDSGTCSFVTDERDGFFRNFGDNLKSPLRHRPRNFYRIFRNL